MVKRTLYLDFCDLGMRRVKTDEYYFRVLAKHFDVRLADHPDVLIYSHSGQMHKLYTCKKVFWTAESYMPDFSECDFAITHRDLDDPRNLRAPVYSRWTDPAKLVKERGEEERYRPEKTKFCAFFTSYVSKRTGHRIEFFRKLSQRQQVDSAGRALNNIGRSVPYGLRAKLDFLRPYKFYMAFENESVPGYTTEKIAEAMLARCIPIYWGNPFIGREFNPKSFLNYHDFPNEEALIDRIMEIDQNEQLYLQYLREPFFHNNQPNEYFDDRRVWEFFERILDSQATPVAQRKKRLFGRWRVVKGNIPPRAPGPSFR